METDSLILTGIGIAVLLWIEWELKSDKALVLGFTHDVENYIIAVRQAKTQRSLDNYEKELEEFRNNYKKHVKPEVMNAQCSRIQAEIKNKRIQFNTQAIVASRLHVG